MNVLLTINSAFCKQAIVLLQSLIDNNDDQLNVFIVYGKLADNDIRLLNEYCLAHGIILNLIKQDDTVFEGFRTSGPFPYEVYYRILAHEYLPKTEERVLYLDTDLVCNGSIEEFYHMDFEGNYLIACAQEKPYTEPGYVKTHWDAVTAARGKYFDNGVLLINCHRFREEKIDIKAYHKATECMVQNYVFDQGLFNFMFAKETKLISPKLYNYRYGKEYLQAGSEDVPINQDARIIHFAGEISPYKPWDFVLDDQEIQKYSTSKISFDKAPNFIVNKSINELSKVWWAYAAKTPVHETLLTEMNAKKEWYKRGISGYLKRLIATVSETRGDE